MGYPNRVFVLVMALAPFSACKFSMHPVAEYADGFDAVDADVVDVVTDGGVADGRVAESDASTTPTNISFSKQVVPIFTKRACVNCHAGNGPGKDQGGLTLNGAAQKIYTELSVEQSPNFDIPRVNKASPEKSLLLTMPSAESPPDAHPTVTFTDTSDPDYVTIFTWIKEGAKNN